MVSDDHFLSHAVLMVNSNPSESPRNSTIVLVALHSWNFSLDTKGRMRMPLLNILICLVGIWSYSGLMRQKQISMNCGRKLGSDSGMERNFPGGNGS